MSEKLTGGLKGNFSRFLPDSGLVLEGGNISGPNLMDLQVNGSSVFNVSKAGMATVRAGSYNNPGLQFGNASNIGIYYTSGFQFLINSNVSSIINTTGFLTPGGVYGFSVGGSSTADLILFRKAAANLQLGAADAATPVAQTLSVQSVVAGTTNTAGANLTITGSQGTGTGAGGSIVFQVAPAGSTGTAQNALANALTIDSTKLATFTGPVATLSTIVASLPSASTSGAGARAFVTDSTTTLSVGLGLAVVGGGANKVPVYSDGTSWYVG